MADPIRPSRSSGPKPLFITFYSFKGGVGRTMALLNVANILAGLGRRVLMIDVDLEAPGLTLFQDKTLGAGTSQKQQGLVDAFRAFLDTPEDAALMDDSPERFMKLYVRQDLPFPESLKRRDGGCLDLLPVGRLDETYERTLYGLDFAEVFEAGVGKPMIDRLKALLTDTRRYDYVLIDSRTGFSDEGSICTRFLGDYLVVLTGLNRQNLRGTARFLERSGLTDRKGRIAMVASPVPLFYEEVRAERLKVAEQMLADVGLDVPLDIQIPYHPLLALDEDPNVQPLHKTDLYDAYQELTQVLRQWANDVPEARMQEVLRLANEGKGTEALAVFEEVSDESPQLAIQMMSNVGFFLSDRAPRQAVPLLTRALELEDQTHPTRRLGTLLDALGTAQYYLGAAERARKAYEQALDIHRQVGDRRSEGNALGNLGNAYASLGQVKRAIGFHEQALDIHREIGDDLNEGTSLGNLGNAYASLGQVKRAIGFHEQALDIHRQVGNRRIEGNTLGSLGYAYVSLGQVERAIGLYEHALDIHREVGDRRSEGNTLGSLGNAYASLGQVKRAIGFHEQALDIHRHVGNRRSEGNTLGSLGNAYVSLGQVERAIGLYGQALDIHRGIDDRLNEGITLGNLGIAHAQLGAQSQAQRYSAEALAIAEDLYQPRLEAGLRVGQITALSYLDNENTLDVLKESWPLIMEHATAFRRAQAHVIRARVLRKHGDREEAAESARTALEFYRPRGVDSVWSREAEEILREIESEEA